jgi:hypothetical protein
MGTGIVVEALEDHPHDFLGTVLMERQAGRNGKWDSDLAFTPFHVSLAMAKMTLEPETVRQLVKDQGFFTMQEPACGSGGIILAVCQHLKESEINYQEIMHVSAIDVRPMCVHMCYIQLTLLHVPAVVIHGNTLSLEEWSRWHTFAHYAGFWNVKLRRRSREHAAAEQAEEPQQSAQTHAELAVPSPMPSRPPGQIGFDF